MLKKIALGILLLSANACGTVEDTTDVQTAPDCGDTVTRAETCGDAVICRGPGLTNDVTGCLMHLRHADGTDYTALCVDTCEWTHEPNSVK